MDCTIIRCVILSFALSLLSPEAAVAWSNNQAADIVLGQPDFTTSSASNGPSKLYGATDGCIDPTTQALWIVSYAANRILMWSSSDKLISGSAATKVLGQPDFTATSSATTADGLSSPMSCALDAGGNLYVSDTVNHRVLGYRNAASKANGDAADLVLGQANFTSGSANRGGTVAANTLSQPWGVAVDDLGNLWVVDVSNHRVLRFDDPMNKANGADADFVLGQADFTSGNVNRNLGSAVAVANSLATPQFVAIDANDTLLVSDSGNNRALRWDNVYSKANGADADVVFGQVSMTARLTNRGGSAAANTLAANVYGVAIDSYGGIYISDSGNMRVLYYNNGVNMASGDDADNVLGQVDFVTTATPGVSATTVGQFALGMFLDEGEGRLWVASFDFNRATSFYDVNIADITGPTMPTVTGDASTQNTMPTWNWSPNGGGNGTFRYKLDDSDLSSGATETTATTYTPATDLSLGTHTLYVQERDTPGNWSVSGSYTIMIAGLYYSLHAEETSMKETGGSGATAPWGLLFLLIPLAWRQSLTRRRG